ncbi:SDR family oxidoreductase [Actinotalea sp. M2MS4P-6]|uniref:SDR family oxidoreductase n=1 Tax=Actinotalea sp. M2MS4P-6 TaxID=2983762 RepID=UPI0021E5033D|nr:SDR family oxidoreductase [Actinotalea sp. M2MS4P-6]MCV2393734.1 SDR family oxidoreductase [Actinotalea sp. M2MS4P-6]
MRIVVTGASGWIGSHTVPELLAAGHEVIGLARSDASADRIAGLGAEVRRGDLEDLASLRAAAGDADGVVHLGYDHDFSDMAHALETDRLAISTLGEALEGRGGPLVVIGGTGVRPGQVSTETDTPAPAGNPRAAHGDLAFGFADRGVRPMVVRFPPTVHGRGDHGFVARLVRIARDAGFAGYPGDGTNRWPAVHVRDAARVVALGVDRAPARTALHALAEEGITTRRIAEAIGARYDLPVRSVAPQDVEAHFGWLAMFFAADLPASSGLTRELLGWAPDQPTLVEDLAAGAYDGA